MSTQIISWIRTVVPVGVASAIAWLLTLGVELDKTAESGLVVGITGLLIAVYYTLARMLESKWPKLGVLLGVAQTPDSYSKDVVAPEIVSVTPSILTLDVSAPEVYAEPIQTDPETPLYYAVLNDNRP